MGEVVVISLAFALLALALPAPANAFLKHFLVHPKMTSLTSDPIKKLEGLSFACPRDNVPQQTLGSVASILGGGSQGKDLALNAISPAGSTATEADENKEKWRLSGELFCTESTQISPSSENAHTYLKDVTIVTPPEGAANSNPRKTAQARCGPNRSVIGGGFRVRGDRDNAVGAQVVQRFGPDVIRVIAHELDSTDAKWQVDPYAICANLGMASSTSSYVGSPVTVNPSFGQTGSPRSAQKVVACPPGQFLIGGGAVVEGRRRDGRDEVSGPTPRNVVLNHSRPTHIGSRGVGWFAKGVEEDEQTLSWRLNVVAICAPFTTFS